MNGSQQSLPLLKENLQHTKNLQARKKQQQQAAANEDPQDWTFITIFVKLLT